MNNVLILGGTGFVGSYLKDFFSQITGYNVFSTSRKPGVSDFTYRSKGGEFSAIVRKNKFSLIVNCTSDYKTGVETELSDKLLSRREIIEHSFLMEAHYIEISSISADYNNRLENDYCFTKFMIDEYISFLASQKNAKCSILRFGQIFDLLWKAQFAQPGFYYLVKTIKDNSKLNLFEETDKPRSYIPIEIVCQAVKKTYEKQIYGVHNLVMPDKYSIDKLVELFSSWTNYSKENITLMEGKKAFSYFIPETSLAFRDFFSQHPNCLKFFKELFRND
jgi:nucleoside-diphosphate-sugar epimerase